MVVRGSASRTAIWTSRRSTPAGRWPSRPLVAADQDDLGALAAHAGRGGRVARLGRRSRSGRRGQWVQAAVSAPSQVIAQVGFGVLTGGAVNRASRPTPPAAV